MKSSLERDAAIIRTAARPATQEGYGRLLERAAAAQCVLIGEASHGTHEFYATRAD